MPKIQGELTPWPVATEADIQQQFNDTCAVKSQQIVMKTFGIDIPEDQLALESMIKGYYMPGCGSDPDLVGKLLNDHGIDTHSCDNANVYDLVNELAQGHKVIVGVDADELWRPSWFNDLFGEEANHALVVTGIDTTDPSNVKVIVTDPGTGDVAKVYPLDQFLDAWHDSNCFYVATNDPVPAGIPEMEGFDFAIGHIPFIGNIPFESYELMVDQFGIFHDDIIKNMNECLERLNEEDSTDLADIHSIQSAFDHMLNVEHMMQDEWGFHLADNTSNICHSLLNDCWDWNSNMSTLPSSISDCMIDV